MVFDMMFTYHCLSSSPRYFFFENGSLGSPLMAFLLPYSLTSDFFFSDRGRHGPEAPPQAFADPIPLENHPLPLSSNMGPGSCKTPLHCSLFKSFYNPSLSSIFFSSLSSRARQRCVAIWSLVTIVWPSVVFPSFFCFSLRFLVAKNGRRGFPFPSVDVVPVVLSLVQIRSRPSVFPPPSSLPPKLSTV